MQLVDLKCWSSADDVNSVPLYILKQKHFAVDVA